MPNFAQLGIPQVGFATLQKQRQQPEQTPGGGHNFPFDLQNAPYTAESVFHFQPPKLNEEHSGRLQYFKGEADKLESWISEKLQAASDESYRDPTNIQAKIRNNGVLHTEVRNAFVSLDNTGREMIHEGHYASEFIQKRLNDLRGLKELLISLLAEKRTKLEQALTFVSFIRQCDEIMFWIKNDVYFIP